MMKTTKLISLLAMLVALNSWSDEEAENFLEGISVLGNKKIAYFSIEGNKVSIHEGEEITLSAGEAVETWQVVRIEQGTVLLKSEKGLTTELRLDSRLPAYETEAVEDTAENAQQPSVAKKTETLEENTDNEETAGNAQQPPIAEQTQRSEYNTDSDKTPKSRVVRTPFGDFVVRDDTPSPTSPSIQSIDNSSTDKEEVPPGHHVIRTPFGHFIVKDKE